MIANWDGSTMKFPSHFSADVKDLILKLIHPTSGLRLGMLKNGAVDVKNHKWFDGTEQSHSALARLGPSLVTSGLASADNMPRGTLCCGLPRQAWTGPR